MDVSRETPKKLQEAFIKSINSASSYSVSIGDQGDLLPFFISLNPGSAIVVDDEDFVNIFNSIYKSNIIGLSVLTNITINSPEGFTSPLKRAVDNYSINKDRPDRVVLVNKSCFEGVCPYYFEGSTALVDSKTTYEDLLGAVQTSSFVRVSTVVGPGTYAKRGALIDFFPSEARGPVRVDFSYSVPKIFVYDAVSQLTVKEINSFSFVVSRPSYRNIKTSSLLKNLRLLLYSKGVLSVNGGKKKFNLSVCFYEDYIKNKKVFVSSFLHSVGLKINNLIVVPPWFEGGVSAAPLLPTATSLVDGFEGLSMGSLLVHEDYGVCLFDGVLDDEDGESFVVLLFKDGKILLPSSRLFLLSIYNGPGGEDRVNYLSKRGRWTRKKNSVSKKINDFVKELLDHHLSRITSTIKRPSLDFSTLNSFIASFKYQDTADQTNSFKEILKDMTSHSPMDRLLCGDVGFGKTEIAIRAAFLSILLGGRVVVLSPTTILCRQLLDAFKGRLSPFAVNVKMVSRLTSKSCVDKHVSDFNSSVVDVLVCTHRIFSHLPSLKEVSLLIIDEEHRFGVKQKDGFLDYFPTLDVLSMSATPIPRSLQNSFSGIKTISTISTPPMNRLPIQTAVDYFDDKRISNYIQYEVARNGQVYFLHNNIKSLKGLQRTLSRLCPNVSFGVVHGQMPVKNIEETISNFSAGAFQVLISTTIIESGLDISNVNTIIINNAHMFGLSQLHQIRGRVGRHSRQAFAYLLIPKKLKLNSNGKKRLKAIEENVSLGSGYNLSSKDLEIRGAGSLFGYNQSGGSQVGFGLYNKILNHSLSKIKDSGGGNIDKVFVDLSCNKSSIPSSYVEEPGLRISLYKSLLSCSSLDDLSVFKENMLNRFGVFPDGVTSLFFSQKIKILCLNASVSSLVVNEKNIEVVFLPGEHLKNPVYFVDWVSSHTKGSGYDFSFRVGSGNKTTLCFNSSKNKEDIYVFLINLLNKFKNDFLENK